jgi:hypothetical protein
MTDTIAGLPFWELVFDAQGDPDADVDTAVGEIAGQALTDLIVFSHGWNNSRATARRLYAGFFERLAPQLAHAAGPVKVGLAGIFWPSQRWADEPIPDAPSSPARAGGGGAAGLVADGAAPVAEPALPPDTQRELAAVFPAAAASLDRMAALLEQEPTEASIAEFHRQLRDFAAATAEADGDGEGAPGGQAGMLDGTPEVVFERFAAQLSDSGVLLTEPGGGAVGLGDRLRRLQLGAKEALRQLTYWQMKNRAGVVGAKGLAPFLARVTAAHPPVRLHLVGHSFGARVVSYALTGLPDQDSRVQAVTLLQGAFSHFAFADPLPFDVARKGALAGLLKRIDGPLVVCFSEHDDAVGRFYPLASLASGEDAAAGQDRFYRWGAMGHDGAQGVSARLEQLQPAGPGAPYRFEQGKAINIDASEVVRNGRPPSGAHSDILHPELTWVVLAAGRIV